MVRWKEWAKFGCGVTAWESVVHASLYLNGATIVLFGLPLTPTLNLAQTFLAGATSVALGAWAWRAH